MTLDRIVRTDVEPRLESVEPGASIRHMSVIDIKRQNCSKAIDSLSALCQHWANDNFPGTLNSDASDPVPVMPCITTRDEAPFRSNELFLKLMGLSFPASVLRLTNTASVLTGSAADKYWTL